VDHGTNPPMLRKTLAVLLASLWLVFSAVDMLEDLAFTDDIKLQASNKSDSKGFGKTTKAAFNLVEHGSRRLVAADVSFTAPRSVETLVEDEAGKTQKRPISVPISINKLHSVFLI
jgi:hypothetical protein